MSEIMKDVFLDPAAIQDGTPANAMIRFFYGLEARKVDMVLEVCQKTWLAKPKAKEKIEMWFSSIVIVGMKIVKIKKRSPTCYDIFMAVAIKDYTVSNKPIATTAKGRVICETHPYSPSISGKWGVNPLSLLRQLGVIGKVFVDPEHPYNEGL